jgi:hypothetical protein
MLVIFPSALLVTFITSIVKILISIKQKSQSPFVCDQCHVMDCPVLAEETGVEGIRNCGFWFLVAEKKKYSCNVTLFSSAIVRNSTSSNGRKCF